MITDNGEAVAKTVAEDLKIDRYYDRVLPQNKASLIHRLKAEKPTAFVGAGINDAQKGYLSQLACGQSGLGVRQGVCAKTAPATTAVRRTAPAVARVNRLV